ncbi:hypothetical protein HDU91_003118, partial [Kappamyces sp. JEL0680]
ALSTAQESAEGLVEDLLIRSLWGNQADLSLSFDGSHAGHSKDDRLIVDDTALVLPRLVKCKRVTLVLDNAGLELYSDLCLAYALSHHFGITVVLECKSYPWFVSDATPADFAILFSEMARHSKELGDQAALWKQCIEGGDWVIRHHAFFTTPHPYWRLPLEQSLFDELCASDFVVFKGDLNYRKMVHDAKWPTTTPFKEAIGPLSHSPMPPFVMLRTCKADTCVGLKEGQEQHLASMDPNWMTNGKFGMIQAHLP